MRALQPAQRRRPRERKGKEEGKENFDNLGLILPKCCLASCSRHSAWVLESPRVVFRIF